MAQVINTNIGSLNAQRNLNSSQSAMQVALQRLSSGLRVNSAKDDAAGMAIASRMESQIRGMNMAVRNANDGISLAQTAEGALGTIASNLARMRELAVQASNSTAGNDIASIDLEYTQLADENDRVMRATQFNGTKLLDPAVPVVGGLGFQIGANNNGTEDLLTVAINGLTLTSAATSPLTNSAGARTMLTTLDTDIASVASMRATFGSVQSRFESVISNLQIASENQSAARSRIMDTDFAAETSAMTRAQILQQAGTAMLAQANQMPNNVLTLLR